MYFLELILSIINSIFKGTTNEKDAKENEDGRAEINGREEVSRQQEANAQADEEENEQKGLQVKEVFMVSLKELLKGKDFSTVPKEHQDNLLILLEKINKVRAAYNKPMTVTSGYRSKEDHIRIYKELAIKRKVEFDETKIPWGSQHLKGAAVDISDPDGKLFEWTKQNEKLMEQIGLWMEEKDDQKRVHYQTLPPKSGKRFFTP